MSKVSATRKDVSSYDTFRKFGEVFNKVYADDERHIYVFRRDHPMLENHYYEVILGKRYKNPDGTYIYRYPTNEEFGIYGFCINDRNPRWKELIEHYVRKFEERGKAQKWVIV